MDTISEMLSRGVEQLLGRAGGPLHFRLFFMPLLVSTLAVRAGLKDAREGRPAFFWTLLVDPALRGQLLRSALKDVGRVLVMAVVLDTTYQLVVLRWFYPVQLFIVVTVCAVVPYVLLRGPVRRLAGRFYRDPAQAALDSTGTDAG